jgi:hypothetical protein
MRVLIDLLLPPRLGKTSSPQELPAKLTNRPTKLAEMQQDQTKILPGGLRRFLLLLPAQQIFSEVFVLDVPVALRPLVHLLHMRVGYASIPLPSLGVGAIHKDEFEHFAQLLLVPHVAAMVLCAMH